MPEDLRRRLSGVVIGCLTWPEFIRHDDSDSRLSCRGPPCRGNEGEHGKALLDRDAFGEIGQQLAEMRGRFLLSINDMQEMPVLLAREKFDEGSIICTITRHSGWGSDRAELLICGC